MGIAHPCRKHVLFKCLVVYTVFMLCTELPLYYYSLILTAFSGFISLCEELCNIVKSHFSKVYYYYLIFTGSPTCRCLTGFTGPNCNLHTCKDYCKNGGNCTVSTGNQPTCRCPTDFLGDQCQYSECCHYPAQVKKNK